MLVYYTCTFLGHHECEQKFQLKVVTHIYYINNNICTTSEFQSIQTPLYDILMFLMELTQKQLMILLVCDCLLY